MKKSTNKDSQRRKLVLQREAIALLTPPQLGDIQGGLTSTLLSSRTNLSDDTCQPA